MYLMPAVFHHLGPGRARPPQRDVALPLLRQHRAAVRGSDQQVHVSDSHFLGESVVSYGERLMQWQILGTDGSRRWVVFLGAHRPTP